MIQQADVFASLIQVVRTAAREGAEEALAAQRDGAQNAPSPLLDKRALAHALSVSTATIDRMLREGGIPFLPVGEVRRFDLAEVRAALAAKGPKVEKTSATQRPSGDALLQVRLLSKPRRREK